MKRITRYRMKNPYMMLSMLILLVMALICWMIGSPLLDFLKQANDSKVLTEIEMTREEYCNQMMPVAFSWEMILFWGLRYMPFVFPIFPALTVLKFVTEIKGYLGNGALRFAKPRKEMRKACLFYSVMGGLTITIPICIYFSVLALFPYTGTTLKTLGGFTDAFPEGFYGSHPYITMMVMACTIYLFFGVAFSLFGCAVAMWIRKKAIVLLAPLILYTALNYISSLFGGVLWLNMCEPVVAYCTVNTPVQLCMPLCEVALLSILLIESRFHLKRGWVL